MSTIIIAVVVLSVLALVFGALLGFASVRFKVEGNPIVDRSMMFYHKPSAANVVIRGVSPTLKPLPAGKKSTNAHQVAKAQFNPWPIY